MSKRPMEYMAHWFGVIEFLRTLGELETFTVYDLAEQNVCISHKQARGVVNRMMDKGWIEVARPSVGGRAAKVFYKRGRVKLPPPKKPGTLLIPGKLRPKEGGESKLTKAYLGHRDKPKGSEVLKKSLKILLKKEETNASNS